MRGLLADVNVQGHSAYLRQLLEVLDLWPVLAELGLTFATFADLALPRNLVDRSLWHRCQQDGWFLFTEDRNDDGPDSLQATLLDSYRPGCLPVLTLANKGRFENSIGYATQVANDVAELLFGVELGEYRDQPRIYVPLNRPVQDNTPGHSRAVETRQGGGGGIRRFGPPTNSREVTAP